MPYKFDEDGRRDYAVDLSSKTRKNWPRPIAIIDALKAGKGVREIMKDFNITYHTIKAYRRECLEFDEDYSSIVDSVAFKANVTQKQLDALKPQTKNPKERFMDHFSKTYKLEESRKFSGLKASELNSFLDPASESYDKEFAEEYEELLIQRKWYLDDLAFSQAPTNSSILKDLLRAEMPDKYTDKVTVDHKSPFEFSEGAERKALKFLVELFGEPRDIKLIENTDSSESAGVSQDDADNGRKLIGEGNTSNNEVTVQA